MKKIILILGIILLLLLTGCGDEERAETTNTTALCPEPEPCPECAICKACDECDVCPEQEEVNCDVAGELVELGLDEITLSTTTTGPTKDIVVAKYTLEQYDKIKAGWLSFVAECDEKPGDLEIELWDHTFYAGEPSCYVTTEIKLDPSSLELGRNTFTFTTFGDVDYNIGDIELLTTYIDGTNETQKLYSISFEPSKGEKESFEKLDDVSLRNYKEYELELTGSEAEEDYTLTFEGDDRDGILIINVNNKEVFNGPVDRHNEITINNEYLEKGTNYISFIGR